MKEIVIVKGYDFEKNRATPEVIENETIVEQSGYEPADKKIMNMIFAGQRLKEARKEMYDYDGDEYIDLPIDPTRKPGLDLAEASEILRSTEEARNAFRLAQEVQKTNDSVVPESVPTEVKEQ